MSGEKKNVTVCTGTTCYVMGAAELIGELEEAISAGTLSATLKGSTCLGHCKSKENGEPPFVEVDGSVLSAATVEAVKEGS